MTTDQTPIRTPRRRTTMPEAHLPDPPSASSAPEAATIPRNVPQIAQQDVPVLQYASGATQSRPAGLGRWSGLVGFHMEAGRDEALDALLRDAGVARIDIRHQRQSAEAVIVPHWSLGETVCFHPVTAGPIAPTIAGCLAGQGALRTAEAGIGLAWPQGERSRMAVRGVLVVSDAVAVLVQLSVRSTMTGFLLAALIDHVRVCQAADDMIDRARHPAVVALHELALPLQAGAEVSVGRGETAQIAPLVSGHPADVDRAYVKSLWRRESLHQAALAAWPGVLAWAAGYRSGEQDGGGDSV